MPNVAAMTNDEFRKASAKCRGGWEAHAEHLRINGDCPWCDVWDNSKWAPPSEEEIGKCDLCGEDVSLMDVEHGNVAEMNDPKLTHVHGIVHANCGLAKGWEVS